MAFGKITKEDLVAAGLDPDKLKEYQEKGITKDELVAFKGEVTTAFDAIKASIAELTTKLTPQQRQQDTNPDPNKDRQKTPEELEEDEAQRFLSNPSGYVNSKLSGIAFSTAVELKRASMENAFREASRTLKGFGNATLKAEIEEEWKKYKPEGLVRTSSDPADLIVKIHNMIIGAHQDEIIQDTNKKDGKYNLVASGSSSGNANVGGGGGNKDTEKDEITEDEQILAKKFGMTDKEWIESKKGIEEDKKVSLNQMTGGR